jgi:acyl-CoA synthetase (AMP-forming)/AMP-acid ligase II
VAIKLTEFRAAQFSWKDLLRNRALSRPSAPAFTFLEGREPVAEWTFGELAVRVDRTAAWLASEVGPGERAVLACPPGLEYVTALWACLAAGVVAVPVYPPDFYRQSTSILRVAAIVEDTKAKQVLTTTAVLASLDRFTTQRSLIGQLPWAAVDRVSGSGRVHRDARVDLNSVPFPEILAASSG